jgi:hypothetical protein
MSPEENFLRYTQESVFSWYRAADEKARTILGFTGVFLSILVGALIAEYAESGGSTARLDGVGLLLFVVAVACHVGAVLFSTTALWSRGVFAPKKAGIAFFGDIANFDSAADLEHAVRAEGAQGLYSCSLQKYASQASSCRCSRGVIRLGASCYNVPSGDFAD